MEDIVFNPEKRGDLSYGPRRVVPTGGALTRAFMRVFKLSDESKANRWLLILAIGFFILSLIIWRFF